MLDKNFLENWRKKNNIPLSPRRNLTEYLQSEILFALQNSKYGKMLTFMGGTCLRFVHKIDRFSEDLDFEFVGKEKIDYSDLASFLKKQLENTGFSIDIRVKETQNIFVIFIKFSSLLKEAGLSDLKDQKLKIKFEIDPNPSKKIVYDSELISTYGRTFNVLANDLSTLFAQKILAIVFRPFQKGRDFYDLVWFLSQRNVEPNYKLLQEKGLKIKNREELIDFLEKQAEESDLKQAAKDVERFLFYPEQAQWILKLPEYLKGFKKS
jgi:predicted nucleotidyltransferase component of viral defense system